MNHLPEFHTPIVVIGKNGQVARALQHHLGEQAVYLGRPDIDLERPEELAGALDLYKPKCIINAAAYTAVDKAEEEEELAQIINGAAPGILAVYAQTHDTLLVHYSTDYVFDGSGDQPRDEDAATHPLSVYGKTKLAGEQAIQKVGCKHFIFRTSWVYDAEGKNFLNTMLRLGAERETLNIVNDQIGAPTFADDIARYTIEALQHPDAPSGIYHLVNGGETSWQGFAEAIFHAARDRTALKIKDVNGIPTADYPTPATRPLNSRLSTAKFCRTFHIKQLPDWQDALKRCLKAKFAF